MKSLPPQDGCYLDSHWLGTAAAAATVAQVHSSLLIHFGRWYDHCLAGLTIIMMITAIVDSTQAAQAGPGSAPPTGTVTVRQVRLPDIMTARPRLGAFLRECSQAVLPY